MGVVGEMSAYLGAFALSGLALAGIAAIAVSAFEGGVDREGDLTSPQKGRARTPIARPRASDRVDLAHIDEQLLQHASDRVSRPFGAAVKRMLDIGFSIGLLVFLAPLLAVTALAVKLDSAGPVLYRQKRVGHAGRVFEVYKFRSMVNHAERAGAQYASINDVRITRVGHVIRHLRIDEIPQCLNVLRGEMSFVGPRPERPEFVATLEQEIPHYQARHLVKPGITGWAQVKYEYAASTEGAREKLKYDLFYIQRYTPVLDLLIVLMTVRVALFGLGSR